MTTHTHTIYITYIHASIQRHIGGIEIGESHIQEMMCMLFTQSVTWTPTRLPTNHLPLLFFHPPALLPCIDLDLASAPRPRPRLRLRFRKEISSRFKKRYRHSRQRQQAKGKKAKPRQVEILKGRRSSQAHQVEIFQQTIHSSSAG